MFFGGIMILARLMAASRRVWLFTILKNCLGKHSLLNGQKRLPFPPAKIIA
jgi:hypothetical protein